MLNALFDLVSFVGVLVDFVMDVFLGLFQLITMLPSCIRVFAEAVNLLPSFLVAFSTVTLIVSVIFTLTAPTKSRH